MESYETQGYVDLTEDEKEWLLLNEEDMLHAKLAAELDMMTEYEIIY